MFQVYQSSDSMKPDKTLALARVQVLLNELLQSKALRDTTTWADFYPKTIFSHSG